MAQDGTTTQAEGQAEMDKFNYMLLARLKQDCEFWLGYGNKADKHLWALNPQDQIAKMRELYAEVPTKPDWLSQEEIDAYAKKMGV